MKNNIGQILFRTIRNTIETTGYVCGALGALTFFLAYAEYSQWPIAITLKTPVDSLIRPIMMLNMATFGLSGNSETLVYSVQQHVACGAWLISFLLLSGQLSRIIETIENKLKRRWRLIKSSSLLQNSYRTLSGTNNTVKNTEGNKDIIVKHENANIVCMFRYISMLEAQTNHDAIELIIEETLQSFYADIITYMPELHLYMFRHHQLTTVMALISKLVENIKVHNAGLLHPSEGYYFQGVIHTIQTSEEMFESDSYLKAVLDCAANNQILATPEAYTNFVYCKDHDKTMKELDIIFHGMYVNMGPRQAPCDIYRLVKQF